MDYVAQRLHAAVARRRAATVAALRLKLLWDIPRLGLEPLSTCSFAIQSELTCGKKQ